MTAVLLAVTITVALSAAARSTWSPCGLSMLSSITPLGERARGHRYRVTASWFVLGASVGGATLGMAGAGLAVAARASGLGSHPAVAAAVAAAAAALGAAVDGRVFGPVLPVIRRQVDDRWLSRYRPWVYGSGFGWQIGVGLATYLMTAAVVLVPLVGALSGSAALAFGGGVAFGTARGLTVLFTSGASTPDRLRDLHGLLDRAAEPVRRAVIGVQGAAAVSLAAVAAVAAFAATGPAATGPVGVGVAGGAAVVAALAVVAAVAVSAAASAATSLRTSPRTSHAGAGSRSPARA